MKTFRNSGQVDKRLSICKLWLLKRYPEGGRRPLSKDGIERNFAMHKIDKLGLSVSFKTRFIQ